MPQKSLSVTKSPSRRLPGIDDALVNANITEGDVTLIDAATGIVVATGHGTPGVVTENAAPGVYVLVIDNGTDRQTIKFIKN